MVNSRQTLDRLLQGQDLTEAQAAALLQLLTHPDLSPALAGAMLAALRAKGVTPAEVRGFAGAMRALARRPGVFDGLTPAQEAEQKSQRAHPESDLEQGRSTDTAHENALREIRQSQIEFAGPQWR